jgi:methyl-accepting chemotaxis protein
MATRTSKQAAEADRNGDGGPLSADERAIEQAIASLTAAAEGDFSQRLRVRRRDQIGELQARVNDLLELNARQARELKRVSRVIGREGRMTERMTLGPVGGSWAENTEAVNSLIDDLVRPTTEVARVIAAVADGDLDQKMALTIEGQPVKGEFARIGTTVNTMVDQLSSFADEVTRVAREVGTEGRLGGQA